MGKTKNKDNTFYYWPSAACFYKDSLWFIYGNCALLCRANLTNGNVEVVKIIDNEDAITRDAYYTIIAMKDELYLIPYWGKSILVYSITTMEITHIELINNGYGRFQNAFIVDDDIICLPASYPFILRIRTNDKTVVEEYDMGIFMKNNNISYFNFSDRLKGDEFILVTPEKNSLYIYDLQNKRIDEVYIKNTDRKFSTVACIHKRVYLCSNVTREIIVYDVSKRKIEKIWWPEGKERISIRRINNTLIIDDQDSGWIGFYDEELNETDFYIGEMFENRSTYYGFLTGITVNGETINAYFSNSDATLLILESGVIRKRIQKSIPSKIIKNICEIYSNNKNIKKKIENQMFDLEYYINSIIDD